MEDDIKGDAISQSFAPLARAGRTSSASKKAEALANSIEAQL
jgi:hypothetical protein